MKEYPSLPNKFIDWSEVTVEQYRERAREHPIIGSILTVTGAVTFIPYLLFDAIEGRSLKKSWQEESRALVGIFLGVKDRILALHKSS